MRFVFLLCVALCVATISAQSSFDNVQDSFNNMKNTISDKISGWFGNAKEQLQQPDVQDAIKTATNNLKELADNLKNKTDDIASQVRQWSAEQKAKFNTAAQKLREAPVDPAFEAFKQQVASKFEQSNEPPSATEMMQMAVNSVGERAPEAFDAFSKILEQNNL